MSSKLTLTEGTREGHAPLVFPHKDADCFQGCPRLAHHPHHHIPPCILGEITSFYTQQHSGTVSSPLSLDFTICKMGKLLAFLWGWQLLGTGAGGREDLLTGGHHGKRPTTGPAAPQSQPPQEEWKGSGGLGHHSRGAPEINKTMARHLKPSRASKKLRA